MGRFFKYLRPSGYKVQGYFHNIRITFVGILYNIILECQITNFTNLVATMNITAKDSLYLGNDIIIMVIGMYVRRLVYEIDVTYLPLF